MPASEANGNKLWIFFIATNRDASGSSHRLIGLNMLRGRTFGAFPKCCKENYTIQSMSLPMQRTCSTIIWSLSSTFARSLWHSVIFTRCARHSCRQVIVRGYQYSCTSPTYFETPHEFLWLKFNNAIDSLLDRVRSSCDSIHGWNVFVYWVRDSMTFQFQFQLLDGPPRAKSCSHINWTLLSVCSASRVAILFD